MLWLVKGRAMLVRGMPAWHIAYAHMSFTRARHAMRHSLFISRARHVHGSPHPYKVISSQEA